MHSIVLSALLCATDAANPVYYVAATDGSDTNPGTIDKSLATLHAARDLLRSTRKNTTSPHATIILRGGVHDGGVPRPGAPLLLGPAADDTVIYLWTGPTRRIY